LQAPGCYLLLARSPRSPVAQALRASAGKLATANVSIRAIFCECEPVAAGAETLPFGLPGEVRIARDTRLLAAHEQLVLAIDRVWIGDCMRREPSKRDAYERFAANCLETAVLASRSFERLWRAAVPLDSMPPLPIALASQLPGIAGKRLARPESPRRQ
jgi:hypothetical protein